MADHTVIDSPAAKALRPTHCTDEHAGDLRPTRPLAQSQRRDDDGEAHLCLEDERGETGRHPDGQRRVEQRELPERHEQPDGQHPAPRHPRARDEPQSRHEHDDEPDRDEQRGRDIPEPEVDDDEVGAPDHRDELVSSAASVVA